MLKMIFPGSFDPITLGHIEIIEKALKIADELIIVITENKNKNSFLTIDERIKLVQKSVENYSNIKVMTSSKMVCEICDDLQIYSVIRGLRNSDDYNFEAQMNTYNMELNPKVETYFIMSSNKKNHISSSGVREILKYNNSISHLVPVVVNEFFKEKNENF